MPNTVLGKVSVVPKGDYSASTTYYALDIVGYNGGSYLAMKEVTGVTPSNDQVNWMQLSGPGLPGVDGVTFTPSVSESGEISWTNDGDKENPDPVDIMGPPGAAAGFGTVTATADNTSSETPSVDVQSSGPDTAKNFTFAFTGLKGKPGDTPDIEIGTVTTLEPDQDATADITGTTPNLTLSLGIPKGQPGTSVSRIQRTSGTGAAGTTDTYTMYDSNDDAIGTFTVYNGANGAGAGDLMADGSVPMTGPLNMGGNKITNLGAPGADTDAVRKSDLDAVAAEVDGILDGTTPAHLSPATDTKIGGVIIGDGLSVEADGTLSADDQLPTGGTQGQILTQGTTGPEWQDAPSGLPDGGAPGQVLTQGESGPEWTDAPDPLPTGGETGQVLTKTASGTAWDDVPSDLPSGGTAGQVLTKTANGSSWEDAPSGLPEGGTEGQMLYQSANGPEWGIPPYLSSMPQLDYSQMKSLHALGITDLNDVTEPGTYVGMSGGSYPKIANLPSIKTGSTLPFVLNVYSLTGPSGTQYAGHTGIFQNLFYIGDTYGERVHNFWRGGMSNGIGGVSFTSAWVLETDANNISFTPTSTVTADNVQEAIEEIAGKSGITQEQADARYLQLTGGTLTGALALPGNPTSDNQAANKAYVDSLKPDRKTATLSASGWSGNSQTITVNGVITDTSAQDIDISCADKASADAWAAGGVWCSNPTQANRLTFTCTTPPTANINLNIRLWEVG